MTTKDIEPRTVGRTKFYQGEGMTAPLFCIEPGISELMGYVGT